jgi:regulator of protease activity HflC (stomatin/prohibitin superfamily)
MDAMNEQKIAEQAKRAAILKAEGAKEAAIREAEGIREKQMLEAEGQANAIERIAAGRAKAIELESNAAMTYFKDAAVTKEQLRVIESSLQNNTKFVMET